MIKLKKLQKYSFLFGGNDLEMYEIKKLLIKLINSKKSEIDITIYDKNLLWGAKLSDYQNELERIDADVIYGVELIEDIPLQPNYRSIDHHNTKSYLPSSIEQIAGIFNLQLSRHQILVAANDKGYIPAMIKAGATQQEIEEVRRNDRKQQGVTEEDEQKAGYSIKNNLEVIKDIFIIKSTTSKFSPITDRMFGKADKLIIYNDSKLCYYGKYKDIIVNYHYDYIENYKAYHGGGDNGYFGLIEKVFSYYDIMCIKDNIINILISCND
jgi:hypothetical protein